MENYLRPIEVARRLRVTDRTVRRYMDDGKLGAVYFMGTRVVPVAEYERFVKDNLSSTRPAA